MAEKVESTTIKLKHVRIAFAKLFKAEAFRGAAKRGPSDSSGEKAFSLNCLVPKEEKDDPNNNYGLIEDTIDDVRQAKWGKDQPKLKADKICFRDGDGEDYDGFADHMYLVARNTLRPKVIDADGKTPLAEEDGKPYSGCICNVWVEIWVQDNEFGKRVNCSLKAVQFVRDGEAFGGSSQVPDEEFTDERDAGSKSERSGRGDRRSSERDSDERGSSRSRDSDRGSSRSRDVERDEAPARRRI